MKPDDRQLEQWLRDIAPPAGLKDRLREISRPADEPVAGTPLSDPSPPRPPAARSPASGWQLAIAAAIAGLGLFLFLPRPGDSRLTTVDLRNQAPDRQSPPAASPEPNPDSVALQQTALELLQSIEQDLDLVELLHAQISMAERERQLARFPIAPRAELDPRDTQSLIAFSAGQSRLEWGGDPASVKAEWKDLIAQYPGTAGAIQAARQLDP